MTRPKDELRAIEDALIRSIMDASPEDTMAEFEGQRIDPHACVTLMDGMAAAAVVAARKRRLAAAKAKAEAFRVVGVGRIDAAERQDAKARLEAMRSGGGPMMLAARKGTGIPEGDEESLVDDLVALERLRKDGGEP